MCCSEVLIGWWSCQVQDRVASACTTYWKSCTSKLEPAKSGGSSDTSLGYYTNESKSLLRSVTHEYVNKILPQSNIRGDDNFMAKDFQICKHVFLHFTVKLTFVGSVGINITLITLSLTFCEFLKNDSQSASR